MLTDPYGQTNPRSVTRPRNRLVGYARVALDPGHAATVSFGFHADLAAFTGRRGHRIVEPGDLELRFGASSGDILLAGREAAGLANLAELVRSDLTIAPDQPRLFKSTGMAWEDLVVAALAYETASGLGWPAG